MSPTEHDWLEPALDAVSGRKTPGTPPVPWAHAYAEALRAARVAVRGAPTCPRAVLRRAQSLFGERGVACALRLVFDSWRDAAPAMRGAGRARNLRYQQGDQALDLRVTRPGSGDLLLQIAAEPARAGLTAHLDVDGSRRRPSIELDESGAGQIRLPRAANAASIRVLAEGRVLMQASDVPLE